MNTKKFTKNFLILLFIINLLEFRISCEDCDCTNISDPGECSSCDNCKYLYELASNQCVVCQALTSDKPYYKKNDDSSCIAVAKNDNYKLLYNTKEVIEGNCNTDGGEYNIQLGNICYKTAPANSQQKDGTTNEYECLNYFYIVKKDFDYYNCYASTVTECPSNFKYYDSSTKECLNSCEGTIKKEGNIYRCSTACLNNDNPPEIEYDETGTQGIIRYCVTTCPSQAKYYYTGTSTSTSDSSPSYKCLEKCDEGHFSEDGK